MEKKTIRFKSLKTKPYIKSIAVLSLAKNINKHNQVLLCIYVSHL